MIEQILQNYADSTEPIDAELRTLSAAHCGPGASRLLKRMLFVSEVLVKDSHVPRSWCYYEVMLVQPGHSLVLYSGMDETEASIAYERWLGEGDEDE